MTTRVREPRPDTKPLRRRWDNPFGDVAIAFLISLAVLTPHLRMPPLIDRLTISNPTPYDLNVAVGEAEGAGGPRLGTVGRESTREISDVIDQGSTWVFRFRGQGQPGGQVTFTRAELAEADWTVQVPAAVEETLRSRGALPSP